MSTYVNSFECLKTKQFTKTKNLQAQQLTWSKNQVSQLRLNTIQKSLTDDSC